MKFICLGYCDDSQWETMPQDQQLAMMEECLAYDRELQKGNHIVGGEALQPARNAVTLRHTGSDVAVTDGPYVETKEQIGGLLILEARDLNHAIALMSKHPGLKMGPFEIRPADEEINEFIKQKMAEPQTH